MLIELDQSTLANMTAALESVCRRLSAEQNSSDARKRIADAIVACAKSGRRNYVDFEAAGTKTLAEIVQPNRSSWLRKLGL